MWQVSPYFSSYFPGRTIQRREGGPSLNGAICDEVSVAANNR